MSELGGEKRKNAGALALDALFGDLWMKMDGIARYCHTPLCC